MSVSNHSLNENGEVYFPISEDTPSFKENISTESIIEGHEYQVVNQKNGSIESITGMANSWITGIPAEKKERQSNIQATPIKNLNEANKTQNIFAIIKNAPSPPPLKLVTTKGPESIFVFDEIHEEKKADMPSEPVKTQTAPLTDLHSFVKVSHYEPEFIFDEVVEDQKNETKIENPLNKVTTEKQTNPQQTSSTGKAQNTQKKQLSEKMTWKGTLVKIIQFFLSPYINMLKERGADYGIEHNKFHAFNMGVNAQVSQANINRDQIVAEYKKLIVQIKKGEVSSTGAFYARGDLQQKISQATTDSINAFQEAEKYDREVNKIVAMLKRLELNFSGPKGADFYMKFAGNKEAKMQYAKENGENYGERLRRDVNSYEKRIDGFIKKEKLEKDVKRLEREINEQKRLLNTKDEIIKTSIQGKIKRFEIDKQKKEIELLEIDIYELKQQSLETTDENLILELKKNIQELEEKLNLKR